MPDLLIDLWKDVWLEFTPASILSGVIANLLSEFILRLFFGKTGRWFLESLMFAAVMMVMTGWTLLALSLPLGLGHVQNLELASLKMLAEGLLLYLLGSLPLGAFMLWLLLGVQSLKLGEWRENARQRTPIYIVSAVFKIGLCLMVWGMLVFPGFGNILFDAIPSNALLIRYTITTLLLADTVCYTAIVVIG